MTPPVPLVRRLGLLALALGLLAAAPAVPAAAAEDRSPSARTTEDLLSSTTILLQGSRGSLVVDLQNVLNELGHDAGTADGIFGPRTAAAVRAFQGDAGITVDGIVGSGTRAALGAALANGDDPDDPDALTIGDSGPDVRDVQVALNALGYPVGLADGIFGSLTAAAVQAFQEDQGLVANGIVGPITLATLEELAAIPPASGSEEPTIRRGNQGEAVALAQRLLNGAGFDVGPADGIFGTRTHEATVAFQTARDLTPDGVIGPATWAVLLPIQDELPDPPPADPDCPPSSTSSDHPWRGEPCIERWRPLVETFFQTAEVDTALGVLRCESWGDPGAVNPLSDTSGLFQHRPYAFDSRGNLLQLWEPRHTRAVEWWASQGVTIPSGGDVFDPETNIAVAAYLVYREADAGGWWHWGTFSGVAGCHDWVLEVLGQG
ncbi:MAG TPA: peptidoglycan-binding protein [Acidimicrobiia bacterium]|nr:peptidoglycan-binding protein [Acidimicrobiia bacterium]